MARAVPGRFVFWLLAAALTLASVVMTVVSVQLLAILQARGLSLAAAVGLGALIGPAQVGSRVVEFAVGRRAHPVWVMLAAMVLVAAGLAMLLLGPALVAVGVILYGAGGGIRSIARGTLPLALFGQDGYATVMGRLALPALVAQAASPAIGALLLDRFGATGSVVALVAAAVANVVPALMLCPLARKHCGRDRVSLTQRRATAVREIGGATAVGYVRVRSLTEGGCVAWVLRLVEIGAEGEGRCADILGDQPTR